MRTILLTGATGFLGSHMLNALLSDGYNVVCLKRSNSDNLRIEHLTQQIKFYDIDIQGVEAAFLDQKIDTVIHTACSYGRRGESIEQVLNSNVIFGIQILDASIKYGVGKFYNTDTLISSDLNDYSLSKSQFSEWLKFKSNFIQVINMRLEHMYGPKDDPTKFVSWVIKQMKNGADKIDLTSGEQLRDFIYIDDVVSAYLVVLRNEERLQQYNEFEVGTGYSIQVRKFIQELKHQYEEIFGATKTKLNFGAIPHRKGEALMIKVNNLPMMDLGWSPKYSLEEGLRLTLEDMKA